MLKYSNKGKILLDEKEYFFKPDFNWWLYYSIIKTNSSFKNEGRNLSWYEGYFSSIWNF